jgi:Fic family protein
VGEVSRYVAALDQGLARLRAGFPLSNRLIREIHGVLLSGGRGSEKEPGEFRRTQNWIGGSRPGNAAFVPPPPTAVPDCMTALETFLHAQDDGLPTLIRAGLAHVQFETIHPFSGWQWADGSFDDYISVVPCRHPARAAALSQSLP